MAINRPVDRIGPTALKSRFGYKAVIRTVYDNGSEQTHIPVRKNFATREAATAYAVKFLAANHKETTTP